MKFLLVTILFVGFVFIVVGVVKAQKVPPPRIEYRYIPRTFVEEQMDPTPVSDIFAPMFYDSTPWLRHSAGKLRPTGERNQNINQFFISQA